MGRRASLGLMVLQDHPQSSTGETPFRLTYGVDEVILVKVGEPSPRLLLGGRSEAVEKDLVNETRQMAHLAEAAIKQRITPKVHWQSAKNKSRRRRLGPTMQRHRATNPRGRQASRKLKKSLQGKTGPRQRRLQARKIGWKRGAENMEHDKPKEVLLIRRSDHTT
ncbi:uncharacterized protein LOC130939697 [Arachis stenosperma]|uniref:uncharacterized protein LOC130939697 n=1 Tax=Arachis stenosperma TaxID=217475 RepID=UPI0025AB6096|nr:uncharacterized protein LOC130939697 [Arachis stenosperma]